MIEKTADLPGGVVAVKPSGTLTAQDYETVLAPLVEEAARDGHGLRALVEIGPEFTGVTPGGLWADVRLGLRALRLWEGCAVVTDIGWMRGATRAVTFLTPFPVRVFIRAERDAAIAWLAALPGDPGIAVRQVADGQVVVVEVGAPLRSADIAALAAAVGPWLQGDARPRGLVMHARGVPGWDNVATLARHVRFLRDHHRRIDRLAMAVDGPVATLAPHVAGRILHPQVRHFDYQRLDDAIAWAAGG